MAELEIAREDIRDGKKWRRNIMKKDEVQDYRETDYNNNKPVIIIIIFLKHNINMISLLTFSFSW